MVMKFSLSILLIFALVANAGPPFVADPRSPYRARIFSPAAAGGGGCTPATGDTFNESFEGTGYQNTYTETGTPNEDAALPGTSPCSGLGSQAFTVTYTGGADTKHKTVWDRGSLLNSTLHHRFYFYVTSESLASTDRTTIYQASESADGSGLNAAVEIRDNAGQLTVRVQDNTASFTTAQNISTATWYRCEVKTTVNGGAAGGEFKLFSAAGSQIGTTATFNTGNNQFRYLFHGISGSDNTAAVTFTIDGVGVNTTGYLGQ